MQMCWYSHVVLLQEYRFQFMQMGLRCPDKAFCFDVTVRDVLLALGGALLSSAAS